VRTDQSLPSETFRNSADWSNNPLDNQAAEKLAPRFSSGGEEQDGKQMRHSFSGHERNHLFLNEQGKQFHDASPLSGVDNVADSRTFVLWDFDRDGWQDIALVNANHPLLNLYHNRLNHHEKPSNTSSYIAVRFVGANHSAQPTPKSCNRDGYGAKLYITTDTTTQLRELRCGEGFAGQNSSTLLIGLGESSAAKSVRVVWPSGQEAQITNVPAGSLVTAFEDPSHSPSGEPFVIANYAPASPIRLPDTPRSPTEEIFAIASAKSAPNAPLHLYVTMATWCASCKKHLPQLQQLRNALDASELAMFGVPYDRLDSTEMLDAYLDENKPPYQLLPPLDDSTWDHLDTTLRRHLATPALPSTVLTTANGQVVHVFLGVPTVSELRRALPGTTGGNDSP
jgi:thiol-disulfide isomerase/thioredoxin